MNGHPADGTETIDGKTSRSICDAVGKRLQQSMRPEASHLPDHLHQLMEALQRQDTQPRPRPIR